MTKVKNIKQKLLFDKKTKLNPRIMRKISQIDYLNVSPNSLVHVKARRIERRKF